MVVETAVSLNIMWGMLAPIILTWIVVKTIWESLVNFVN